MSNYELINPDGSSVTPTTPAAVPALPGARVDGLVIREGTMDDLPFIDAQQQAKINKNRLGFLKMKVLIGKVDKKHVLIACDARGERIGYLLAQDQYLKRGDLGMITQMCVIPEYRRSLVAAHLLKAQFDRSAYGCRLYCCWCAQDLRSSNDFWEAMGFVPLAFRTGSEKTTFVDLDGVKRSGGRIHIFWQKRIRPRKADGSPDDTPYWYPSETSGGAIGAARIVLPNPLGTHWSDIKPVVLPAELLTLPPAPEVAEQEKAEQTTEGTKTRRRAVKPCDEPASGTLPRPLPRGGEEQAASVSGCGASGGVNGFGVGFGPSPEQVAAREAERAAAEAERAALKEEVKRNKAAKRKAERARLKTLDPALCAYSRELRDRWSEAVSAPGSPGATMLESAAKPRYAVGRVLTDESVGRDAVFLGDAGSPTAGQVEGENAKRLAA